MAQQIGTVSSSLPSTAGMYLPRKSKQQSEISMSEPSVRNIGGFRQLLRHHLLQLQS